MKTKEQDEGIRVLRLLALLAAFGAGFGPALANVSVSKGASENGSLVAVWSHPFGKIWYHVYPIAPSPAVADLGFGSAAMEVVSGNEEYYAKSGVPGEWYCFNAAGGVLWSRNTTNDEARTSPTVADVDGDGDLEIGGSTTSGNQFQLLNHAGSFLWRYAVDGYANNPASPALCDVFAQKGEVGGNQLEMVAASLNGYVYCLDADPSDGTDEGIPDYYANATGNACDTLWKFQAKQMGYQWVYNSTTKTWSSVYTEIPSRIFCAPAVADLDGDGVKEVVVGCDGGVVYCLRGVNGAKLWEYKTGAAVRSSAALADVDGDGVKEVFVGSQDFKLYCLSAQGAVRWSYQTAGAVDSSPTVADADGDGVFEVFVGSSDKKVYCLNAKDGGVKWSAATNGAVLSSPTPANRTGSRLDLYVCSNDGFLYLINGVTGAIIDRFYAGAKIQSSPSVADIDGDGHLEVLFMDWAADNNNLDWSYQSIWGGVGDTLWCLRDMASSVAAYQVEWPMFRGDPCHSGAYTKSVKKPKQAPPTLAAKASPESGEAPLTVALSMELSTPGKIVKYEWDLDGNGTYDWASDQAGGATATFSAVGTYSPTARVTDDQGQVVTDSVQVLVQKALVPPVAQIEASPVQGSVPLGVQLGGVGTDADGQILTYEWDFDGDGNYDWSSTSTGKVAHTYTEAGLFKARFRVTDNDNLSAAAEVEISAAAAKKPPVVMATALPGSGEAPLKTVLTAVGTDEDGQIVLWEWDFDGDGNYDWSSSASAYSGSVQRLYAQSGVYNPKVRATDNDGLSAMASTQVVVTETSKLKVWIAKPKSDWLVSGSNVSVRVQTAPGSVTSHVKTQYRKQGDSDWIDIATVYPPPYSFFDSTWNVSAHADGQVLDLRAIAYHVDGQTTAVSDIVVVTVHSSDPDVQANLNGKGEVHVKQKLSKDQDNEVTTHGGVSVKVDYGTLPANTHMEVTVKKANEHPAPAGIKEAGTFADIELENVPSFNKPLTITLPYKDDDDNGAEDDSGVPVDDIKMYAYTPSKGLWEVLPGNSVNKAAKTVTAQTPHLSSFGLFGGASSASFPGGGGGAKGGGGGGGSCFISSGRDENGAMGILLAMAAASGLILLAGLYARMRKPAPARARRDG